MLARGMLGPARYLQRVLQGVPTTLPNLEDAPILRDLPGAKLVGRTTAMLVDEPSSLGDTLPRMSRLRPVETFVLLFLAFVSVVVLVSLKAMHGPRRTASATAVTGSTASGPATAPAAHDRFSGRVIAGKQPCGRARERIVFEFERRFVERALAGNGGNVTRAAEASGVGRRYFYTIRSRSGP